jgi:hypothetical protein
MDARTGATTVIYVGGTGRSGSTMLANVLGEVPGYVSVGEVRFLWQRGIQQNRLCGCGEQFADCTFWNDVLDAALGPGSAAERQALAGRKHTALEARTRLRTLPQHLRRPTDGSRADGAGDELAVVLDRVYAAIAAVAGASVVVDSSKLPTYAALLDGLDGVEGVDHGIDLRVAHFLRDPRAAAYSWQRKKLQPDLGPGAFMERRGAGKSAVLWSVWNRSLEMLAGRRPNAYARVTYEEFLADPREQAQSLLDTFALDGDLTSVFAGPDTVRLSMNHTVAGNPSRHQQGLVPLVVDSEWRDQMSATDRGAVAALTWPTLRRYGYHLRS